MNTIQPERDDVVWMKDTGKSPVRNLTFLIDQVLGVLKSYLEGILLSSAATTANDWIRDGVECEFLDASEGGGWQKGKLRIRLEFVPDEPPTPASEWLRKIIKFQEQQ